MEVFGTNSAGEATKKAVLAPAQLLAKTPVDAFVDLLSLKNPIAGIQSNVRSAIGDLALWPFRFTGHVLAKGAKTTLKLGWGALVNTPFIPTGNDTSRAFVRNPAQAIRSFESGLSAGKSPAAAFRMIAPARTPDARTGAEG